MIEKTIKHLLITCACMLPVAVQAQVNLVLNPSFEDHTVCPYNVDQIKFANYWTAIDSTNHPADYDTFGSPNCTPEYCNICSSDGEVGSIPIGARYYHYPHSGNGMAQVMMYYNESFLEAVYKRDYLQGRLKSTLIAGLSYCVTFYVTLEQQSAYASNKIGAYLDDGTIDTTANCGLPQTTHMPQVYETAIIDDTLNWVKVQGSFTADGTEKFITIGNFFSADEIDTIPHVNNIMNSIVNWYLVDDVSVIPIDAVATAGNDITIAFGDSGLIGTNDDYLPCRWYTATGTLIDSNHAAIWVHPTVTTSYVMELDVCGTVSYDTIVVSVVPLGTMAIATSDIKIYPAPAQDKVTVTGITEPTRYRLLNAVGVTVMSGVIDKGNTAIDVSRCVSGVYVVEFLGYGAQRVMVVKE